MTELASRSPVVYPLAVHHTLPFLFQGIFSHAPSITIGSTGLTG